jgi:hypothetical protein
MSAHNPTITQGYLHQALTQGMEMAISFLASLTVGTPDYLITTPILQPTSDGAYIISHVRKDNSSQLPNFVIFLAHPRAYAMLATVETPIKIRIPTTITIAGSQHQQIIHIQLNPHNISILDRAFLGLFQIPHTQSLQPTIIMPTVHQTKGVSGCRSAKMTWAVLMLQDTETLQTYKEYARKFAYEAGG